MGLAFIITPTEEDNLSPEVIGYFVQTALKNMQKVFAPIGTVRLARLTPGQLTGDSIPTKRRKRGPS